jgi:glycosyltransferase involved in cell wall biosynthesis
MKRVCLLFNHDLTTQTRTLRQVETLLELGYDITVFCLSESPDRPKIEHRGRLTIRRIFHRRLYKYHMFSLRTVRFFFRIIACQPRFDAVHVIDAPPLLLGWMLSRFWRAKLVYDSAELWDALYDEEKALLRANIALSKRSVNTKSNQVEKSRSFESWVLPRCDGVISVNDTIGELIKKKAARPIPRYITLRNIANYQNTPDSRLLRDHFNLPEESRIIIYQGQIAEKRGLHQAVAAMEYIRNAVFIMVGPVLPADETFFNALQNRIHASPTLRDRVFYQGFIPSQELVKWTASADLGLHPIINWNMNHYLCLPNKIFEYIQAGVPIAASNFPEMQKIIAEYQVGFTFDPENPQEMADKINCFLDDSERHAYYRAHIAQAKGELCWEKEKFRLISMYEEIFPKISSS